MKHIKQTLNTFPVDRLCRFKRSATLLTLVVSSSLQAVDVGPTTIEQLSLSEATNTVTLTIADTFGACSGGNDIAFTYDEATLSASYYALLMTARSMGMPITVTYENVASICQLTGVQVAQ